MWLVSSVALMYRKRNSDGDLPTAAGTSLTAEPRTPAHALQAEFTSLQLEGQLQGLVALTSGR